MTPRWLMIHLSLSLKCNRQRLNMQAIRSTNHSPLQSPMSSQILKRRSKSTIKRAKEMDNQKFWKTPLPRKRKSLRSSMFSSHRLSVKNKQAAKNVMKSIMISTTKKEASTKSNGVWACSRCFFRVPVFSQTSSTSQRWSRFKSTQWNTKSLASSQR